MKDPKKEAKTEKAPQAGLFALSLERDS